MFSLAVKHWCDREKLEETLKRLIKESLGRIGERLNGERLTGEQGGKFYASTIRATLPDIVLWPLGSISGNGSL